MKPHVSVIIPTCNRPKELAYCLRTLLTQLPQDQSVEVLVCDDSSDDRTKDMVAAEFPQVKRVQGSRRGPAKNRNGGAKAATGDWLIFLDDDCEPSPEFLAAYLKVMSTTPADQNVALEGATYRIGTNASLMTEAPHNPTGGMLISCNFAIPRQLFIASHGFDERFPMAVFEDTEFAARMELQGLRVIFVKEAAVDHPLRPTPPASKLARRWESRVISTYDFGGTTAQVAYLLPRHIFLVILSRFRGKRFTADNIKAAFVFAKEFLLVLWWMPGWLRKYHAAPRSPFWVEQQKLGKAPPTLGL